MDTIEKKVADAILQRQSEVIMIDGREFPICSPTPGTLILVSEIVSKMPFSDKQSDNLLLEVLSTAKDMSLIGAVCAVLILGAKRVKENKKVLVVRHSKDKHWSWKKFRYTNEYVDEVLEVDYLAELILDNVSNSTLKKVFMNRLGLMEIGDFFSITTSLREANLLRPTKEVVQTASGD